MKRANRAAAPTFSTAFQTYRPMVYRSSAQAYTSRTGFTAQTIVTRPRTFSRVDTTPVRARYSPVIRPYFEDSVRSRLIIVPGTAPLRGAQRQRPARDETPARDEVPPTNEPPATNEPPPEAEAPSGAVTFLDWLKRAALAAGLVWAADTMRNAFTDEAELRAAVLAGLREIEAAHPRSAAAALRPELESWMRPVRIVFGSVNFASGSIGTFFSRADIVERLTKAPTKAVIAELVKAEYEYYLAQEWWPVAKAAGVVFTPEIREGIWYGAVRAFRDGLGAEDRDAFDVETNNEWRP